MVLPAEVETRIRRLVLSNAVDHEGAPRVEPIVGRLLATDIDLRARAPEVRAAVETAVSEIRGLAPEEQERLLAELGPVVATRKRPVGSETGDFPDLPNATPGKVVLRMAPFPSGALHIGNARMIYVNDYYRRKYDGRILLVFDDTVGSEEKRIDAELFEIIEGDLAIAGCRPDSVYYKSDRVPLFYPWARRIIEAGGAYVCVCPALKLRANRVAGIACPERSQTVEQSLDQFEKMLGGTYGPGEAVLRLKTSLSDPDPAFRDRVLLRLSDLDHPRVGRKYRVWPMLEFSWAVDDIELGITHVLRGKDLVMEDRMQEFIWNLLGIRGPSFHHWGLLRLREAKISKSKSYQEVKSGIYDGWTDPRTWSIRSLDRRGICADSLRRFTLSFGMSLADIEVPAETLYAENRSLIDSTTLRRSITLDPVLVEVDGFPEGLERVKLANHPDRPELGVREVSAGPRFYLARSDLEPRRGTEVRLKDLVNVQLPLEIPATHDEPVHGTFTSRENRRLPRLQWVGQSGALPVDLLGLDGSHRSGMGERTLAEAAPGDIFQFERVGFGRIESDWKPGESPLRICFGHP